MHPKEKGDDAVFYTFIPTYSFGGYYFFARTKKQAKARAIKYIEDDFPDGLPASAEELIDVLEADNIFIAFKNFVLDFFSNL